MHDGLLIALTFNTALLLAVSVVLEAASTPWPTVPARWRSVFVGVLLGAIGMGLMLVPFTFVEGLTFDTRSVLLATAGFFFGPLPAATAAVLTAALRWWQGGVGASVGIGVILTSTAIGLVWRRRQPDPTRVRARDLYALGLLVHLVMLAWMALLPHPLAGDVLRRISLPVLGLYPLATVALGLVLVRRLTLERTRAELADSEARFRGLFEHSHAIMLVVDPTTAAILDANPAAVAYYGWTHETLTSMKVHDINTLTPPEVAAAMARARAHGGHSFEFRHRRADGAVRDVEVYSGPTRRDGRQVLYSLVIDVHDRRQAEARRVADALAVARAQEEAAEAQRRAGVEAQRRMEDALAAQRRLEEALAALRHQQAILAASQRVARLCSWTIDPDDDRVAWSDEAYHVWGVEPATNPPPLRGLRARIDAEDRPRVEAWLAELRAGAGPSPLRFRVRRDDGQLRVLQTQGEHLETEPGAPARLIGTVQDVTDQAEAEVALRQLSAAVEQSPLGIAITDLEDRIEYVNPAFEALTGYDRAEVVGRTARSLDPADVADEAYEAYADAVARGEPWKGELGRRRRDGRPYVDLTVLAPLTDADGRVRHLLTIREDVTERRLLAAELEAHREHLEDLVAARTTELADARRRAEEASAAKSAFLANMSHEIRTPMNAILGLSHLLLRDDPAPAQRGRLQKIDAASRHLLGVISDVLDLAKIESGKLGLVEDDLRPSAIVDQVRSILAEPARRKGLDLRCEVDDDGAWLRGDAARLRQALLNLAGNAVKFTERGFVTLRARHASAGPDGIVVHFEVEDSGIGIAPEVIPRLFRAFEQADASTTRRFGGSGLGLAITRRLAELMGGEVGVRSAPDAGTTVWFTARLQPAADRPRDRPSGAVPTDAPPALHGRVLLAEDHEVNREVALEVLRGIGLHVDGVEDGREAVAQAQRAAYDVVLMDLQMPEMDGLAATRALRALPAYARVPILAMTANVFQDDREACLQAGMNDFVPKPVDPAALEAVLRRWLAAGPAPDGGAGGPPANGATARRPPPPAWPHGDLDRGLDVAGGDPARFRRLLRSLLDHHAGEADALRDALLGGEPDTARRRAHALKGAAATLGAEAVRAAAQRLELHLAARTRAAAPSATAATAAPGIGAHAGPPDAFALGLVDDVGTALVDLAVWTASWEGAGWEHAGDVRPGAVPATAIPAARATEARHALTALEPLLTTDDAASGELVAEHRAALHDALGPLAGELEACLAAFDFPAALRVVRRARAVLSDDGAETPLRP